MADDGVHWSALARADGEAAIERIDLDQRRVNRIDTSQHGRFTVEAGKQGRDVAGQALHFDLDAFRVVAYQARQAEVTCKPEYKGLKPTPWTTP